MNSHLAELLSLAAMLLQNGQVLQAREQCQQIVQQYPGSPDALHLCGLAHSKSGNDEEAERLLAKAVQLNPAVAAVHNNHGVALKKLGRISDAEHAFREAIKRQPGYADAHNNLGNALLDSRRHDEALASIERAIALRGDFAPALNNRGAVLLAMGRHDEAVASFDRAIAVNPHYVEALNNRANALREVGRLTDALKSCDRALAHKPDWAAAHNNRGAVLAQLRRWQEAIGAFDAALRIDADDADAHCNRGNALLAMNRLDEAIASFQKALAVDSALADAHAGLGEAFLRAKKFGQAAETFATLTRLDPEYPYALGNLLHARMLCGDWRDFEALRAKITAGLARRAQVVEPFVYQGIAEAEADLMACAQIYAEAQFPARASYQKHREAPPGSVPGGKLTVGYLCGEFRQQATSMLMCGVYEQHDKDRFKIVAFDNGGSDGSEYRRRIESSFDELVDIRNLSDADAAALIRRAGVDVLVNLNGYFGDGRQGVFAHRPCGLQVNYLGFPGTLGAPYIDYLIADRTVIPEQARAHYVEKVVYLPHSYQANDSRRAIAERSFTRADAGLPADAFVFCCFNNSYKITPPTFDCWMRVLNRVPGSVLWLLEADLDCAAHLKREAQHRGVAGERLVFAKFAPPDEHLARHPLADLFLDTLPYNAHTTASDALWAGLPVLTLVGTTFAGRVGASLLQALDLPELITTSEDAFEVTAASLASEPDKLAAVKKRLRNNAAQSPLFDTRRTTRALEAAYAQMVQRHRQCLPPTHFAVDDAA